MTVEGVTFFQKLRLSRAFRRASDLSSQIGRLDDADLTEAEHDIERLRQRIDEADRAAEHARAALAADIAPQGAEQCDWSLRPDLWKTPIRPRGAVAVGSGTPLSQQVTLYHDCPEPELSFRQIRAARGLARYHLTLEVFRFRGGFVSLAQTLPDGALAGLTRSHIFTVKLDVDCEESLEIYSRLNLQSGPNTEQLVREMPVSDGQATAEFDLAYTKINEKRMEKVWLDLIFEGPQMNRVLIRDMTITRAPRADI